MKFIIGVVISILIFALFYFMAIFYVKFDAGVKYINYILLAKESIISSIKLHILVIPIIFLTSVKKNKK